MLGDHLGFSTNLGFRCQDLMPSLYRTEPPATESLTKKRWAGTGIVRQCRVWYSSPMPTLLKVEGFKFFFYANEHEPRHVHAVCGSGYCKIELGSLRVARSTMRPAELRRAVEIAGENHAAFEREWDEFFRWQVRPRG
jgi:hypothetical protein